MAFHSNWKGFMKLSLVSIPVKAYAANQSSEEVCLNQLHAKCNNRIKYKKVCPVHGEVRNDEIIKGYEYSKSQYVTIDTDELEKLRTENDHSIQIDGFLKPELLDPIYHAGKNYFIIPDGAVAQKPYALLLKGMQDNHTNAIAQVVISGREQVVLLRPKYGLLMMTLLYHKNKIKSPSTFKDEISDTELSQEELDLTKMLIKATTIKKFDFSRYKDNYIEKLTNLIQFKVDGKEVVQVSNPEEPKVIDLMEALKKSVAKAQGLTPKKPTRKKMAPSVSKKAGRKKDQKKIS